MMNEIDVDRDGELDIDEFIALMSMGDELEFRHEGSRATIMNIRSARKLNALDFFKCFKSMPVNFIPSFIGDKWSRTGQCTPASIFMPSIDPRTMLYKDLLPINSAELPPN